MRVLIADDQRSFATTLADMVRYCGHEVVAIVGSGFEAIQAYTLHKPDLVLMDHRMPKLNGVTASRHIIAKNPEARVVLLSGWSPEDGADQSGAMCYLPKPVELARLNATLLTISHTFPPPNADLAAFDAELPTPISEAAPCAEPFVFDFVPIPQEIISPVETFPLATFPAEVAIPENDAHSAAIMEGGSTAADKPPRKRRSRRPAKRVRTD